MRAPRKGAATQTGASAGIFSKTTAGCGAHNDGRRVRLLVFAGSDQRDRTFVIRRTRIGMKTRVHLRRSGEREREEKGRKQATRDNDVEFFAAAHGRNSLTPLRRGFKRTKLFGVLPQIIKQVPSAFFTA